MTTNMLVERHPLKEKRRANKPLLERKRRAKINDSLADLKYLVLTSLNKDVSKFSKMEKVDILDMTVRFLKGHCLEQRQEQYSSIYRTAYSDIYEKIMGMNGVDHSMKCQILSNLTSSQRDGVVKEKSPPPSPTLSNEPCSPLKAYLQTFDPYPCLYLPPSSAAHVSDRRLPHSPVPETIQRPHTPLTSSHSTVPTTIQRPHTLLTSAHSTTLTTGSHALSPSHHRNSVVSRRPSHPASMAFQSPVKCPELSFQPSRSPESCIKVWRPW